MSVLHSESSSRGLSLTRLPCTWLVLAAALLGACADPVIVKTEADVRVEPDELVFPDSFVGHPSSRTLRIRNVGRAPTQVSLEIPAPFFGPDWVDLRAGEIRDIEITFAPSEPGSYDLGLRISSPAKPSEVRLLGQGLPVPNCGEGDECRSIHFDPALGCVEIDRPEGSACGDACLVGGQCHEGSCVGTARECGETNACTTAFCDPTVGCVVQAKSCQVSTDFCTASECDPEVGCVLKPANESKVCGPSDCSHTHVCRQGLCTEERSKDRTECGETTPCLAKGYCDRGACVQDRPTVLKTKVTFSAGAGARIHFDGTTNADGDLYWAECGDTCFLARGSSRSGFLLGKEPMSAGTTLSRGSKPTGTRALLLAAGRIVSTLKPGWIEAYDSRTVKLAWKLDLAGKVPVPAGGSVTVAEVSAQGSMIYALVDGWASGGSHDGGWAVGIDLSGNVLWVRSFEGTFSGLVGDDAGRIYFSTQRDHKSSADLAALVSLGATGGERWRQSTSFNPPLAVSGDLLFQGTSEWRKLDDGSALPRLKATVPLYSPSPIFTGKRGYFFGLPVEPCGAEQKDLCSLWELPSLIRFATGEEEPVWGIGVNGAESWWRSEPVLTKKGSLLFADTVEGAGVGCEAKFQLREIEPEEGAEVFACELPAGGSYLGATSLHGGRWAVLESCRQIINVYEVEDRELAPKGWVTYRGNPARTGTPR
ncbi:hypothetical protein [Vulgatibacter incomptus]|uniref:Putative lipoprotein n=1 Tax=Vulgatibacter incomptus TaxID=1391653 RepID=A0A0K1PIF9_9BACT|nr:hypothetical protein [Vulgatibacter incomptus]AKU93300.1 putative lipoprotein [Vulgatibacter incomptus]